MGVLVASTLSLSAFVGWAWLSDRSARRTWKRYLSTYEPGGSATKSIWR
jgi:hypothetical protein